MKTNIISTADPDAITRALEVLDAGGLIAFPTDTVYGIAAKAFDPVGIARLYEVKTRSANKAISVLLGDLEQLPLLTPGLPSSAQRLAERFWPGALTLVVTKHPDLPDNLSPLPTVGVRIPDYEFTRTLLRAAGPLATTSANISGEASTLNGQQVLEQIEGRFELLLDGGEVPGGVPSTVVDCTQDPPRVLRSGPLANDSLFISLTQPS
jgi:L-threonylcarbamoyladenylate synthase